jgi:hypothetical protein
MIHASDILKRFSSKDKKARALEEEEEEVPKVKKIKIIEEEEEEVPKVKIPKTKKIVDEEEVPAVVTELKQVVNDLKKVIDSPRAQPVVEEKVSVKDIKDLIKKEGWKEINTDNKEELFLYVIENLTVNLDVLNKEKDKNQKECDKIKERVEKLVEKVKVKKLKIEELENIIKKLQEQIEKLNKLKNDVLEQKEENNQLVDVCDTVQSAAESDICNKISKKLSKSSDNIDSVVVDIDNSISEIEENKNKIQDIIEEMKIDKSESIKSRVVEYDDEKESIEMKEAVKPTIGKSVIVNTCFTSKEYTSLNDLNNDLVCPEGEVCDIDKQVCKITNNFSEIKIGDNVVKVSGKDEVINKIKDRIMELSSSDVELKEKVVEEEKVEEEIVEEEPVKVSFDKPLIRSEVRPLGEIVNSLKNILSKKPITSAQNKIKIADRNAMNKLAKCAGV